MLLTFRVGPDDALEASSYPESPALLDLADPGEQAADDDAADAE